MYFNLITIFSPCFTRTKMNILLFYSLNLNDSTHFDENQNPVLLSMYNILSSDMQIHWYIVSKKSSAWISSVLNNWITFCRKNSIYVYVWSSFWMHESFSAYIFVMCSFETVLRTVQKHSWSQEPFLHLSLNWPV